MDQCDVDLLAIERGAVTAPAGCGKTHLIAEALKKHADSKPILVLTHTNAGVAALRGRLDRAGVPSAAYRLMTIDGWAMRLTSTFPQRSECGADLLKLINPGSDYPNIRRGATRVLNGGHIDDILRASYSGLLVDEYQDSSRHQHAMVNRAADALRTCVLGDPLQAIFGFGGDGLPEWDEVCNAFPIAGRLETPWRWVNAGAETLGAWLLGIREPLLGGGSIDLRTAPENVIWIELDGTEDHQRRLRAAQVDPPSKNGTVLIIGDSTNPASQQQFASQIPGAVTVEAVDLKDLTRFGRQFNGAGADALSCLASFAQSVMTNVGAADLLRRVETIRSGRARKPPNEVESAALAFLAGPSHAAAVDVLVEISKDAGVRVYRPAVLRACFKALQECEAQPSLSFYDATVRVREESRLMGRSLPRRAVGSTLLMKGLEAEVAVVLNAEAMNARHLYVAMTRGAFRLVVCSRSPILMPQF
uniref:UvrD-like helicase ATP-binding domain-containing protein n=1 Tax=mine drainage metagenome TaxID=410659 RepID=E6PG82_9ZZZZ